MINNREQLIHLSREVERVAVLQTRNYYASAWTPEKRATAIAMQMALEGAHLAFGFGDDARIAAAIKELQEFKDVPERANG